MLSALLVALLLVVPGAAMRAGFGLGRGRWGCGVLAVDATLSLGFLAFVLLPLYLLRAPVVAAPWAVGISTAILLTAALCRGRPALRALVSGGDASYAEWALLLGALLLLVPATLAHSGANVDDWWDLSFVSGWLVDGHFDFAQMALSPDPGTAASAVHPRFLWSVWLMLQALVSSVSGEQPWRVQAGPLAAATSLLVVSAQAALARALFRSSPRAQALTGATVAATVAWVWATEAIPLFVRGYQDKLFAGFVLAPVLIALVIDSSKRGAGTGAALPLAEERAAAAHRRVAVTVGVAALATVSVHSLVFTMAAFVAAVTVGARRGKGILAWVLASRGVVAGLLGPALYPLGQAIVLAGRFGDQGISLATRDNPVVRAHLALGRLLATSTGAWIVHPGAVFGGVAVLVPVALVLAWRRRGEDGARMLLAMTLVPCALLFVPGLAAAAGTLWVPWMLYRLGWMIPVAPLLAYAIVEAGAPRTSARLALGASLFAVMLAFAGGSACDRLRRDLRDHPGPPPSAPGAAAAVVYDFLRTAPGRDAVLAPPNFAELAPALTGKPVVAFSERGTLVFSMDETLAYERLRDRARFFFEDTAASERAVIARRYGARWAVLPRRLVASGREEDWLWRFGPEALLAARRCDDAATAKSSAGSDATVPAGAAACRGRWTASPEQVATAFGPDWRIALATRDYFLLQFHGAAEEGARNDAAARGGDIASRPPRSLIREGASNEADAPRWLRPFARTSPQATPSRGALLASTGAAPGAVVTYDVPPRFVLPSVAPIWLEGPGAWEDAPAEASISIDAGVACRFDAVEVLPHLPRERREVLEVTVDDRTVIRDAHHGEPILVSLDATAVRSSVTVQVRSLLGNPVSLSDVRLLGDPATCTSAWPVHREVLTPSLQPEAAGLVELALVHPGGARTFIALARRAAPLRGQQAAVQLLQEAVRRDPSLAEAWIELGFAHEELATQGVGEEDVRREREQARAAFGGAVRADSNSAWARGSAAWADRRAGHTLAALVGAFVAAGLDPLYGDAWTIAAYALGDLRLYTLAERALEAAEATDPARNWPVTARADLAMKRRDPEALKAARASLAEWIRRHPFDATAREKLSQVTVAAPS